MMNDKNTKETVCETLSALLDNEAGKEDALELRRLARALEDDVEGSDKLLMGYQRYSMASAVMRDEAGVSTREDSVNFLQGVRASIEQTDEFMPVTNDKRSPNWRGLVGQFAVAASVAMVAVMGVGFMSPADSELENIQVNEKLGSGINRQLNSRVLSVSAGSHSALNKPPRLEQTFMQAGASQASCVVADNSTLGLDGLHQLKLPEGLVLCRMDKKRQRCQTVSSQVACRLE